LSIAKKAVIIYIIKRNLLLISAVTVVIIAGFLIVILDSKKQMVKKVIGSECVKAGCSGQLCLGSGEEGGVTTCEWRAEYQCFKTAICEKQTNGKCGFSQSAELQQCLAKFYGGIDNSTKKSR
jgi:hypothetical protein